MKFLTYILLAGFILVSSCCFAGSYYYQKEIEYNDWCLETIDKQQEQLQQLIERVKQQQLVIDTYKGIYEGRIEITITPKELPVN